MTTQPNVYSISYKLIFFSEEEKKSHCCDLSLCALEQSCDLKVQFTPKKENYAIIYILSCKNFLIIMWATKEDTLKM